MLVTGYLCLAAGLPLVVFLLLTFFGRRIGRFSGALATTLIFGSLALSVGALVLYVSKWAEDRPGATPSRYVEAVTRQWVTLPSGGGFLSDPLGPLPRSGAGGMGLLEGRAAPAVSVGLMVDSLTVVFFIVVSFLATMVHLFSLGYVGAGAGDGGDGARGREGGAGGEGGATGARYFAMLNLLCFGMFALLLSNSLLQLFAAWQLVGIATYFLIHFHADRRGPVMGSLRTFVVNRIGDAAFLAGLGLLVTYTGPAGITGWSLFDDQGTSVLTDTIRKTLQVRSAEFLLFSEGYLGLHWLSWAGICFLVAAVVRAAQFPFFTWIADTTEAPAPATALLQTCTSVAAGVYLLARLYPILTLDVRLIMAILGCGSAVLGALIACAQTDFRRILGWTTVSQVGFVLLFMGAGGYMEGVLHLFTHAFTKAGLLLAAASVMRALPGQTDLKPLGGLWKRMPITAGAALVSAVALAGTPLLSGAYSANKGLAAVYDYAAALAPGGTGRGGGEWWPPAQMMLFWLAVAAVYVTAFAIGRWWWLLFVSPVRNAKLTEEAHESAPMTLPLIIMAGFSVGMLFEFFGIVRFIERSLAPSAVAFTVHGSEGTAHRVMALMALAPAGLVAAFLFYFWGFGAAERVRRGMGLLHVQVREAFYLDAFYHGVIARGVLLLARLAYYIDRYVLSAIYRLVAFVAEAAAHLMAGVDAVLDRPVRRAAWVLVPLFRRLQPVAPGSGGANGAAGAGPGGDGGAGG